MNKLDKPLLARQRKKRRNSKYKQRIKEGMALLTQKDYNEYHEQLYANKLDNLNKMEKFLKRQQLLKLTQKERENLNRPITDNNIELIILKI